MKAINVLLIEADMLWSRLFNKITERDPSTRVVHIQSPEEHVPLDASFHGRTVDIVVFDPAQISHAESGWFYRKLSRELDDALLITHSPLSLERVSGIAEVNRCIIDRHVVKPNNLDDLSKGLRHLRDKLAPLISSDAPKESGFSRVPTKIQFARPLSGVKNAPSISNEATTTNTRHRSLAQQRPLTQPRKVSRKRTPMELVVIGSSTGGPKALASIIPQLAAQFRVPILIAQHMPEKFTELLAQQLDKKSELIVREAKDNTLIHPGEVWIAPGDRHLLVRNTPQGLTLRLDDGPPVNACRPAIDLLFRSAAEASGENTLALALTGMGHDGRDGGIAIKSAGGHIIAQDEATSVVWGIPGAIVKAGIADEVVPLDQIAHRLTCLVESGPLILQNGTHKALAPRR